MTAIMLPVLIISGVGAVAGVVLSIASVIMAVPVDERQVAAREALPGANCGACGFTGCDGYAEALAGGEAAISLCAPGGASVREALASILGVEAGDVRRMAAFVQCNGCYEHTTDKMEYIGETSCAYASQMYGGQSACSFGCLGFGDCVGVCEYDAVHVVKGVAVVDPGKCVGCSMCVAACPKGIIAMAPAESAAAVACSSTDRGADVRKLCSVGCIGCTKCAKDCPEEAIQIEKFLARVDYDKCTACGTCAASCPQKTIKIIGQGQRPALVRGTGETG